jgi:hypothetical protein
MPTHADETRVNLGPEPLIPLAAVPKLLWLPPRRRGSRLSVATVWRWCKRGAAGVSLRHVSVGGTLCTTESALLEFFETVAARRNGPASSSKASSASTQRQRQRISAENRLEVAGMPVDQKTGIPEGKHRECSRRND